MEVSDSLLLCANVNGEPGRDTGIRIGERTKMVPGLGGGEPYYVSLEHSCLDTPTLPIRIIRMNIS
jgi:hypothetical protein